MTRYGDADILRGSDLAGGYDATGRLTTDGTDAGGIRWAWTGGAGADAFSGALGAEVAQHEEWQADLGRGRGHIETFLAQTSVNQQRVGRGLDHYEIAEQRSRALREANVGRPLSDEGIQQYWAWQNVYTRQKKDGITVARRGMTDYSASVDNLQANLGDPVLVAQKADNDTRQPATTVKFPVNGDPGEAGTSNERVGQGGPYLPSMEPEAVVEVDGVPVTFTTIKDGGGKGGVDYTFLGDDAEGAHLNTEGAALFHALQERDTAYLSSYNSINLREFRQAYQELDLANREQAVKDDPTINAWLRWSTLNQGDHVRSVGEDAFELGQARTLDEHERNILQRYELALDGQEQSADRQRDSRDFQIGQDLAAESEDDAAARLEQLVEPGTWTDETQRRFDELRTTHSLPEVYRQLEKEFGITSRPKDSDWPSSGRTPEEIWGRRYPETPGVVPSLQTAIDAQKGDVEQSSAAVAAVNEELAATERMQPGEVPDRNRVDAEKPTLHYISAEEAEELIATNQQNLGLAVSTDAAADANPLGFLDVPLVVNRGQATVNRLSDPQIEAATANLEMFERQDLKDAHLLKRNSELTNEESHLYNQNNEQNNATNVENTNRSIEQTRDQGLQGDRTTAELGQENRDVTQEIHGYDQEYADRTHAYDLEMRAASQQAGVNEERAEDLSTRLSYNRDALSPSVRQIYDSVQHDYYEYAATVRTDEIDHQVEQAYRKGLEQPGADGTITQEEYDGYQRLVHQYDVDRGLLPEVEDRPTGDGK
ncbi:MAG: hypothetical protein ACRCYR_04230 [Phycicoccus sp.]